MKLITSLLCSIVSFSFLATAAPNPKPFVIPELREWTGAEGSFELKGKKSIVFDAKDEATLKPVAELFAEDIRTMFGKKINISTGKAKKGDIVLSLSTIKSDNTEAYELEIKDIVAVRAHNATGAYWATRTLLQLLEQSPELRIPQGTTLDYPKYALRGFMLDCARKFFTIDFLRDYVKFMSYYKMNTFQIHLNDNGFKEFFNDDWNKTYAAFRLECDTYPGLTAKDGSYSKKEFIDLQKMAEARGVNIIPEIDVPAHSLAFSHYLPEIGSKDYGMDHLDLFNPKTYEFLDGLFKEYLEGDEPVFRGKQVCIGTDEYSNRVPEVVEKFRYFTDYYIRYVEKFGKQAVIWGALTHAKGDTPVKSEDVIMNLWHNPYAQPRDMAELGYNMISIPDGRVYIVPEAGYYYNYLNTDWLYKNWEPKNVGGEEFEENDPHILGGMFAIWNDHVGNGISEKDAHHRIFPAMQTLAVKMWTGSKDLIPFEDFQQKRLMISEAPGVNINATLKDKKGLVLKKNKISPGDKTGMKEIGFDYKVEFTLAAGENDKGTVLFTSPNATVYLSDPEQGKLGFARDGYLIRFDYTIPVGEKVNIVIEGTNKSTKLYINGELKESLDTIRVPVGDNPEKTIASVRTLVFPLERAGKFKGKLTNFKVSIL